MAVILAPAAYGSKTKIYAGEVALDGSNPTPIVTPFKTIYAVSVNLKGSAAPALTASTLTYDVSGGTVNVYAWKPTGAGDTTLVTATDTDTISYVIVGR